MSVGTRGVVGRPDCHYSAQSQIADMKAEAQQEKEEMLAMIRAVKNEVKLQTLIINSYIPHEYQEQLETAVQWQEETGEWHMVSRTLLYF